MPDFVLDARGGTCPHCKQDKRSLAQHWAKSQDCDYPDLSSRQHDVVRGLLLGDASLGGRRRTSLEVQSVREPRLRWLHHQLDWLSRGITQDSRGTYRLRTLAHPSLDEYQSWRPTPPSDWSLTTTAARVWYACDGTVGFTSEGARAQLTFAATDAEKQDVVVSLLEDAGFTATAWERRVALDRDETGDWLDWLGTPPPGSEHKWATTRDVYRRLRAERPVWKEGRRYPDEAVWNALRNAADDFGHPPSAGDYEQWRPEEYPAAITAKKREGSWEGALEAAGLDVVEKYREYGFPKREVPVELLVAAVREADRSVDGTLTIDAYQAWRDREQDRGRVIPHQWTISQRFDATWPQIVDQLTSPDLD